MITEHKKRTFHLILLTIGHSNHSLGEFVALLHQQGVQCLVDVRSVPYSSYHKDFVKENLQYELPRNQIKYQWMGDSLGGKREELKNSAGVRMDDAFNEDPLYRQGLVQLMRTALRTRTAIMCSEEDPRSCHRHKIIADSLLRRRIPECHKLDTISVLHIRGDGRTEDAANIVVAVQGALPL